MLGEAIGVFFFLITAEIYVNINRYSKKLWSFGQKYVVFKEKMLADLAAKREAEGFAIEE